MGWSARSYAHSFGAQRVAAKRCGTPRDTLKVYKVRLTFLVQGEGEGGEWGGGPIRPYEGLNEELKSYFWLPFSKIESMAHLVGTWKTSPSIEQKGRKSGLRHFSHGQLKAIWTAHRYTCRLVRSGLNMSHQGSAPSWICKGTEAP